MKIKANLILPSSNELMKIIGFGENGKIQKYIDSFVLHHCEPYVAGKHIHEQGVIATKIGSGQVIWNSPDANYLYDGNLMVDPITLKGAFFSPTYGYWSRPNTPKIMDPSGRKLEYHSGGKRGDHWFDRMIENEMDELVEGTQNIANGGKS